MSRENRHPASRGPGGNAPAYRAGPPAAYRAALAKVEPGEAFLARTRRALAGETADAAPRGQTAGLPQSTANDSIPPCGQMPGSAGQGRPERAKGAAALRPFPRPLRRVRLTPLRRGLLPAACLALLLAAVPAGRLLGGYGGGAPLSGGAAAQAADEQLIAYSSAAAAAAEDTAAAETTAETAPAERSAKDAADPVEGYDGYAAPAGEPAAAPEPAPEAASEEAPRASDTPPVGTEDAPEGEREAFGGAPPAGGDIGGDAGSGTRKETGGEDTPADNGAGSEGSASAQESTPADSAGSEARGSGEETPAANPPQELNKLPAGWNTLPMQNSRAA